MHKNFAFAVAVLVSSAPALAQNPLAQLGLTEIRARELTNSVVQDGGRNGQIDPGLRKMFVALPGPVRGTVTTAMWAWAKTYVSSAAFKTEYAKARTEATPQPTVFNGTVDAEVKAQLDEQLKAIAETRKTVLPQLPADQRAAIEASLKQQESMLQSPEFRNIMKQSIEAERVEQKSNDSSAMVRWRNDYPADPQVLVARRLREFLGMCTDVDFAAKTEILDGKRVFSSTVYERKPAEWKECFRAGPEAVNAARAAASAWLKQIAP